jgi:hypothetical protein
MAWHFDSSALGRMSQHSMWTLPSDVAAIPGERPQYMVGRHARQTSGHMLPRIGLVTQ